MLRFSFIGRAGLAVCAVLMLAPGASAQTKPGEIKGIDAMGDKNRSAQDGWSQAPVPREGSASKDAADPGGNSTAENKTRPVPSAATTYAPGKDPQAPAEQQSSGPSRMDLVEPTK